MPNSRSHRPNKSTMSKPNKVNPSPNPFQLEQGNVEEAARTYEEDLSYADSFPRAVRHPNNVWALRGYHECLVKLGRHGEAKMLELQLTLALAGADISIESSCFCRRMQPAANQSIRCESIGR
ncbi:hypothetical protein CNBG_9079 [Cryptococcus deuterogattii R265]|uniref:uncharacterized protein n=1 Tax=Cryptococcus deuterogattii (strain R265) TaxID=294750 RepID=UPI001934FBA8|nr:hypothetical protein CNBG_9079 [Cryptococcus deuterogattii R265]